MSQIRLRPAPHCLVGACSLLLLLEGSSAVAQGVFDPDMVFSIREPGPTIGQLDTVLSQPILEGDILGPALQTVALGPLQRPGIRFEAIADLMLDATGPFELDALSFGVDDRLANASIQAGYFWFSVDCLALGEPTTLANPSVRSEGFGTSNEEAEADVFINRALGPAPLPPGAGVGENVGAIDGNGLANQTGIAYPGVGLVEGNPSTVRCVYDDLDALDMHGAGANFPIYLSLDAATAGLNGALPGDVLIADGTLAPTVYASAANLGLDLFGPGTDNLDALILAENGIPGFQAPSAPYDWDTALIGADMLLFSVDANSPVVGQPDSLFGQPIQPGDVLMPPIAGGNGRPAIFVAAESLGLATDRNLNVGDDLNALSGRAVTYVDCNGSGSNDADDIAAGIKQDVNRNGIPDECEGNPRTQLNEIQVTQSTPTPESREFIELLGPPGDSLDNCVLLIVEGTPPNQGILNQAWDLTGFSIPPDGYFVIGPATVSPDYLIAPTDEINNGAQSFILIQSPDPLAVLALKGSDLDLDDDGVLRFHGNGVFKDAVATIQAPASVPYVGAFTVIDLPPDEGGILRGNDAPNPWCLETYLDYDLGGDLLATPGAANVPCEFIGYNIDTGQNGLFPLPDSSYAAAAAQPGQWNAAGAGLLELPLVDSNGLATGASYSEDGATGVFEFDNPGTSGDDEKLLDDLLDIGGLGAASTITIRGLADGDYEVYTYAWAPDNRSAFCTDIDVPLAGSGAQTVCGNWPGAHALGVTYALHQVTILGNAELTISATTVAGFGSLNGIQIKPLTSSGPSAYCVPGSPNSVSALGAVLTSAGGYGTAGATFDLTSVPNQPGILYAGPNQLSLPFGCGDRCVGGLVLRGPVVFASGNQILGTPFDMSPPSALNIQYWYRDPANLSSCGAAFNLSNALQP